MKNLFKQPAFTLLLVFFLQACKKNSSDAPLPKPKDVYVAGLSFDPAAGTQNAVYWKNGKKITIDSLSDYSQANNIFVTDNNDVYAAGSIYSFATANRIPVYWKNKTIIPLAAVTEYGEAKAITVSGNDVYVAGELNGQAVYWKNGVKVILEAAVSGATDVKVIGNDVYVAGYALISNITFMAKYWKNGVEVNVGNGTTSTVAYSILLKDNDVYLTGTSRVNGSSKTDALYWKNGVAFPLVNNPSVNYSEATGIAIAGTDIYVVGNSNQTAKCWKNAAEIHLESISDFDGSWCYAVFASGADIYIAGTKKNNAGENRAIAWKNGSKILLDTTTNGYSFARGIFVK